MSNSNLILVAGCNGSGKSTYSTSFLPKEINPFDADKRKKEIYESFKFDFEFRELMSWNRTQEEFEYTVAKKIEMKEDFAYETNFNDSPLHWVHKFKSAGYSIQLLFFSLRSIELAIERVAIRFQSGGHYVQDSEVATRYKAGFNNLDKHFSEFDSVVVFESSVENEIPQTLFICEKGRKPQIKNSLPAYFKKNCPDLSNFILTD